MKGNQSSNVTLENLPKYSAEDHQTWHLLYNKNSNTRTEKASSSFFDALCLLEFTADRIPDFQRLNNNLKKTSGWEMHMVEGLVPESDFFKLLFQKKFPVVQTIRKRENLDYTDLPDIFHDIYAHIPLLTNPHYTQFLRGLSKIAAQYNYDTYIIELISRVYWYTAETGLVYEGGKLKIYGAAVISSHEESDNALSDQSKKCLYSVSEVIQTPFNYDIQSQYFVLNSFEELSQSIEDLHVEIENKFKESVL